MHQWTFVVVSHSLTCLAFSITSADLWYPFSAFRDIVVCSGPTMVTRLIVSEWEQERTVWKYQQIVPSILGWPEASLQLYHYTPLFDPNHLCVRKAARKSQRSQATTDKVLNLSFALSCFVGSWVLCRIRSRPFDDRQLSPLSRDGRNVRAVKLQNRHEKIHPWEFRLCCPKRCLSGTHWPFSFLSDRLFSWEVEELHNDTHQSVSFVRFVPCRTYHLSCCANFWKMIGWEQILNWMSSMWLSNGWKTTINQKPRPKRWLQSERCCEASTPIEVLSCWAHIRLSGLNHVAFIWRCWSW